MSGLSVTDYMKRLDQLASKSLTAPEILASASKRQPLRNLTDNKRTSDKPASAKVRAERNGSNSTEARSFGESPCARQGDSDANLAGVA